MSQSSDDSSEDDSNSRDWSLEDSSDESGLSNWGLWESNLTRALKQPRKDSEEAVEAPKKYKYKRSFRPFNHGKNAKEFNTPCPPWCSYPHSLCPHNSTPSRPVDLFNFKLNFQEGLLAPFDALVGKLYDECNEIKSSLYTPKVPQILRSYIEKSVAWSKVFLLLQQFQDGLDLLKETRTYWEAFEVERRKLPDPEEPPQHSEFLSRLQTSLHSISMKYKAMSHSAASLMKLLNSYIRTVEAAYVTGPDRFHDKKEGELLKEVESLLEKNRHPRVTDDAVKFLEWLWALKCLREYSMRYGLVGKIFPLDLFLSATNKERENTEAALDEYYLATCRCHLDELWSDLMIREGRPPSDTKPYLIGYLAKAIPGVQAFLKAIRGVDPEWLVWNDLPKDADVHWTNDKGKVTLPEGSVPISVWKPISAAMANTIHLRKKGVLVYTKDPKPYVDHIADTTYALLQLSDEFIRDTPSATGRDMEANKNFRGVLGVIPKFLLFVGRTLHNLPDADSKTKRHHDDHFLNDWKPIEKSISNKLNSFREKKKVPQSTELGAYLKKDMYMAKFAKARQIEEQIGSHYDGRVRLSFNMTMTAVGYYFKEKPCIRKFLDLYIEELGKYQQSC